ncbi:response regulator [Caballeronia grimmiae]|uniref:response regulator n=1 Tax=Caballeronia grimmiae TaxID=1071679 RepID=UPI0038BA37C4
MNSGAELIRVLKKNQPADLVITDIVMQGVAEVELDGLRLVSKLRRSYPDIPLVILTMTTSGGIFHELCKLGVAAIVSKEEPPSELAQISLRALATSKRSSRRRSSIVLPVRDRRRRILPASNRSRRASWKSCASSRRGYR